jgi:hypothetical protein
LILFVMKGFALIAALARADRLRRRGHQHASVPGRGAGPISVGEPPYTNDYGGVTPVDQPVLQCFHEPGVIWNPTWSSNSVQLAYSLPDGIHVMDTTNYKTGGDCPADSLLIPGGAEPAFGPRTLTRRRGRRRPPLLPAAPTPARPLASPSRLLRSCSRT